jgi:hypothetical protein
LVTVAHSQAFNRSERIDPTRSPWRFTTMATALAARPTTRRNGFHPAAPAPVPIPEPDPLPTAAEIFAALAEPWPDEMIYTRPGEHGKTFAYVTWPMVARRLDEVLGPDGWETDLTPLPPVALRSDAGDTLAAPFAVKCSLTIILPDGRRITRASIGEGRSCKAADTDAGKRAARLFGVAAYLYSDDSAEHPSANATPEQAPNGHTRSAPSFNGQTRTAPASNGPPAESDLPTTGKRLYGWARDRQLLDAFGRFGRERGFPARLTEWHDHEVAEALAVIIGQPAH